jgi:hypothetical protein
MKINKLLYSFMFVAAISYTSCSDFLDIPPTNIITGEALTDADLPKLTSPLYNVVWSDFNGQFYYGLGDGRAYNLFAPYSDYIYPFHDLNESGLTGPLVSAWASFYVVIQQANNVILSIHQSTASQEVKDQYTAEARFMRGLAYWYLASLWGNAIICEDPAVIVNNPLSNTNPRKDVYDFAIRDMEFAAKYLPATVTDDGRVSKYTAFGMLSRFYLDYSGLLASNYGENPNIGTRDDTYLELAKKAAEKVIGESSFRLLANYADLFIPSKELNNNSEILFALQWIPGLTNSTGWQLTNTQQAYFAFSSQITGDDAAWGDWTRCPYDMLSEYEAGDVLRRHTTWMGWGDHYPEIDKANGGLLYERNASPSVSDAGTALNVKKGVTGSAKDYPGIVGRMNSGLNTRMLRLAEVYLNYADAILGNAASTTDATALEYFNAVRTRAGLSPKTSIAYSDLRHERRVEFCMEGRYWYDLVARAYYKQQEVINYINDQDRGNIPGFAFAAPSTITLEPDRDGTRSVNPMTKERFLLPYPQTELVKNPKLGETPVPYTFTEERITDLF